ncbi:MAG: CPBP family intramembrane metalloprotease [Cyanobacteria bacterium QH_8_48_120]|nr:MAG: CPBP family intramembrane metalloprotease [Cyanobacteria bacterium QH_1_48_107]PSO60490.1 MAG: CPBP family intramembrane metalloprotease [Cyanobacteria bacterium QH_10_48_56]PSO67077.1 MAG: CPBP family intramembrane metalloprotease [Cyanobacteria bacterium QH_7_48_89]PSO72634.1 MAG: CPBP family intramembrane metalloprotease [Cyanobacteria bacterium QH_3_48_40]PSO73376.1 MAG: CPBP family intramembrane metalloprotease [Cyanobacteria bacterium QS_1_48_34]PSO76198.1 MAG: CPBP family intram
MNQKNNDYKFNYRHVALYPAPVRLGIFILTLGLIWLPVAAPIYLILSSNPNLVTILTMGLLLAAFLLLLRFWSRRVYQQAHLLKRYGLEANWRNGRDLFNGLSVGLSFVLALFALEGILGWLEFQPPTSSLLRVVVEGLVSALGVGLAEELLFRGWLLDELQHDYAPETALWANAIIFALLHFLKPLAEVVRTFPELPGLILLGLTLVWARHSRQGRLAMAVGLHAGLVWGYYIVNVGQLVQYGEHISPWLTGVDGNPLAGVMGLVFLGVLALGMRKRSLV